MTQAPSFDFSTVDSLGGAATLAAQGTLEKIYLFPPEFGGDDVQENVVYVPTGFAAKKAHIDLDLIAPLVREGKVNRYVATPAYAGNSWVPVLIEILATGQTDRIFILRIWGEGSQEQSPTKP